MITTPRTDLGPVESVLLLEKDYFFPYMEKHLSQITLDEATGLFIGRFNDIKIGFIKAAFSPQIAIKVEQLNRFFSTRNFIRIGTCGGLDPDLRVGTLLAHSGAVRDEGTSKCYISPDFPAVANFELMRDFTEALSAHVGLTWTTDGRYAETNTKIETMSKLGVISVEMETAALYITTSIKSLKALSLSVISDRPIHDLHHDEKGKIDPKEFQNVVLPRIDECIEKACQLLARNRY